MIFVESPSPEATLVSRQSFEGTTPAEILAELESYISDGVHSTIFGPPLPVGEPDPNAKWRLISALQKSIRRGDVWLSCALANLLDALDSSYLWGRLKIVAYEDVGAANPRLVGAVVHLSKKTNRKQFGRKALFWAIYELCKTPKDRTACDLSNLAMYTPFYGALLKQSEDSMLEDYQATLAAVPVAGLTSVPTTLVNYIFLRFFVGDVAAPSAAPDAKYATRRTRNMGLVRALLSAVESDHYQKWLLLQTARTVEGMSAALPILATEFRNEEVTSFPQMTEENGEHTTICGLPSYAFDGHTIEGKKAFGYWMKSRWAKDEVFCKCPEIARMQLLKSMVFHAEGTLMNLRLASPTSDAVLYDQRTENAKHFNLTYAEFMSLVGCVQASLAELNHIRAKVS